MRVDFDGERIELAVVREAGAISLAWQGQCFRFDLPVAMFMMPTRRCGQMPDIRSAPMSGAVVACRLRPVTRSRQGDALMVIEAMKMEHAIVAQAAATVSEILFAVGDQVEEGETLVILEVE